MELEWKWNGKYLNRKKKLLWNGNGMEWNGNIMEKKYDKSSGKKIDGME